MTELTTLFIDGDGDTLSLADVLTLAKILRPINEEIADQVANTFATALVAGVSVDTLGELDSFVGVVSNRIEDAIADAIAEDDDEEIPSDIAPAQ